MPFSFESSSPYRRASFQADKTPKFAGLGSIEGEPKAAASPESVIPGKAAARSDELTRLYLAIGLLLGLAVFFLQAWMLQAPPPAPPPPPPPDFWKKAASIVLKPLRGKI